jgi:uncharacterized membrane protein
VRKALRCVIAAFYIIAGISHILVPRPFMLITPDWVPYPFATIVITGAIEIALTQAALNGTPLKLAKDPLLLWINDPTLALEDPHPQLLNIRRVTFRSALIHLEVVPTDRFRRGQRASGRPHATNQMLMLGRATAQSMQIAIEKFQRFNPRGGGSTMQRNVPAS